ncbi:MAG TPA: 2-phospho-L-lactate transferase CofD family protein [Umezawaea sp.]|nr:2-phospho-L-lactate transferase CofD family protein [Umezawaea sp.]
MRRRVVLFCGGSGASRLVRMYAEMDQVDLTVLVNCYDDGLSTGALRRVIPGLLGPSDVRKNVRSSLRRGRGDFAALDHVLGLRFRDHREGSAVLARPLSVLRDARLAGGLSRRSTTSLVDAVERFADYLRTDDRDLPLRDVALGNVVLAGLYLEGRDFNESVRAFAEFAGIRTRVLNLTDGRDLRLVALTDRGQVVPDESGISSLRSSEKLADVFVLDNYLTDEESRRLDGLDKRQKRAHLSARSRVPRLNPEAGQAIAEADVIIYWPGTQHSSLLPSYLTEGLAEAVSDSRADRKVLVMNAWRDNDIHNESAYSLVDKFLWFMSRKGTRAVEAGSLATDVLLNRTRDRPAAPALPLGSPKRCYRGTEVHVDDWSDGRGGHAVPRMMAWLG